MYINSKPIATKICKVPDLVKKIYKKTIMKNEKWGHEGCTNPPDGGHMDCLGQASEMSQQVPKNNHMSFFKFLKALGMLPLD